MDASQKRLKKLELLSGLGAGILGAGLGLVLVHWLQPYALPILVVGALAHGWAMWAKQRIERQARLEEPVWVIAAEWICWLMIAGLVVYVAASFALGGRFN